MLKALIMKRIALLLLITTNFAFAQQWVTHKMSNGIEIDFPKQPAVIDTSSAYTIAFTDTAGVRLMATDEPFDNYRYPNKITNLEDLGIFYDSATNLLLRSSGATLITSSSSYKNDLLVRWVEYTSSDGSNECAVRILLTDRRVYFFQGCCVDSSTLEIQRRFLVSLNVTFDHLLPSQFETETASERQRNAATYQRKGMAIGYVLVYISIAAVIIWLSLFIILLVRTRSAEAPPALRIMFNIFRWLAVGIFGFGLLMLLIGFATNPGARNFQAGAMAGGIGLLAVVIAILRPPSFNKPSI